jgi:hypothetical protein
MKLPPFDAEFYSTSCKINQEEATTGSKANVSLKYSDPLLTLLM